MIGFQAETRGIPVEEGFRLIYGMTIFPDHSDKHVTSQLNLFRSEQLYYLGLFDFMLLLEPYPHQLVFLIVLEKREIRRAQKLYFLIISVPTGFSEIW